GRQDHGGAARARSPRPPAPQTRAHAGTRGWIPGGWLSLNSIARGGHLGQAAAVRGQSNQVLSEVLRAGREATAGLSPLTTSDTILICNRTCYILSPEVPESEAHRTAALYGMRPGVLGTAG